MLAFSRAALAVQWTPKSRNGKVGAMPVSTTSAITCPDACPLKEAGCYAKYGPLGMLWSALSGAIPGETFKRAGQTVRSYTWTQFCSAVSSLALGTIWRHNQAGDLPGENDAIDAEALRDLVAANSGRRGFTYTHKPITGPHGAANAAAIADANARGFTINLSADNLAEADQLANADIGPVVVVLPEDKARKAKQGVWLESEAEYKARANIAAIRTPEARRVVVCPATYRDDIACIDCQLCQRQRTSVVGFPAHGNGRRKASAVASAA